MEDEHLDQDAQEALTSGRTITREVHDEGGHLYHREVKPYIGDIGGVLVTYRPANRTFLPPHLEFKGRPQSDHERVTTDVIQSLAMGASKIGVWTIEESTNHLDWDARFGELTGFEKHDRPRLQSDFLEHILEEDRAKFEQSLKAVREASEPQELEIRISPPDRGLIWLQIRCVRVNTNGLSMIVGIVADVTERKENKERSEFMMRELDHRVKNLLAIILSIAEITARSNSDIDTYKNDFRGRLESMARTHNLLAQTQWSGSDLADLVKEEVSSLAREGAVSLEGPFLEIAPAAAQSLAMFFHELTINALRHGALSNESGCVCIRWKRLGEGSEDRLRLTWEERGGPPVLEPSTEGFGGKVINRIVKRQLRAEVETHWDEEGFVMTALIPMETILPSNHTSSADR